MFTCRHCAGTGYTIRRVPRTITRYQDTRTGRVLNPWDELLLGPDGRKALTDAGKIKEVIHKYDELVADPSRPCKACRGRGRPQPADKEATQSHDGDHHEGAAQAPLGLGPGAGDG